MSATPSPQRHSPPLPNMTASLESLPPQTMPLKPKSGRVEDFLDLAESVSVPDCSLC
jgi:hypothetical protein